MKTRLLIIIAIVIASSGLSASAYVLSVQNQCESLLGDTHYPRPLTFWNCFDYLEMIQGDKDMRGYCGEKYMLDGLNECILNPEFIEPNTIIIYDVIGNSRTRLSVAPHVMVMNLTDANTVTFVNNGTTIVNIFDNSKGIWHFDNVSPSSQITLIINGTGYYEVLVQNSREGETGQIVVLGDDVDSLSVRERAKMAQAIISGNFREHHELVGVGSGGAPGTGVSITINEKEFELYEDAKSYYYEKYSKIIPFDVPITIEFAEPIMLQ